MKDIYMLDFLGINKPVLERELELKMVQKLKELILELGYGFAFIGNQYKISTPTKDYFLDLLFYHRKLKCLVAFELKVGEFKAEYAGKPMGVSEYRLTKDLPSELRGALPSLEEIKMIENDSIKE